MEIEEIRSQVKKEVSEKRFLHCLGVEERAAFLAQLYGENVTRARYAGIAHDIAKQMSEQDMVEYMKENNMILDETEKNLPKIWHAKIGAVICQKKFEYDEQLQQAIAYHTTGSPEMDTLAKIIYLADITEKNREYDEVEIIRKLSEQDINEAMIYAINREIKSKIQKDKLIHPISVATRNKLLLEKNSK